MNEVYLTDIVIRYQSDSSNIIPEDARLSIEVSVDGSTAKMTKHLAKEPTELSWWLNESIKIVSSTTLAFIVTYPNEKFHQLGFTNMVGTELLANCTEQKQEIVRALIMTSDCPPLELVSHCIAIPPGVSQECSSDVFADVIEEEAVKQQWNLARLSGQSMTSHSITRILAEVKYELAMGLSNDHQQKLLRLMRAGKTFDMLHQLSHNDADLDTAIAVYETAIKLMQGGLQCQTELCSSLTDLGNSCSRRFERFGDRIDIDKAISAHEKALGLIPDGQDDKPRCLINLGNSFLRRFEHFGDLVDINDAISAQENAVNLTTDDHADKAGFLSNLANSFIRRSERTGDIVDIKRGICEHKAALSLTPDGNPDKATYLSNLGLSFLCHFQHARDFFDIDEAISAHRNAVRITPDGHAKMPGRLNNMGNSYLCRFEHSRDIIDLDEAISAYEKALCLTPDGRADKPGRLSNLGNSFLRRFERSGDIVDINRAIAAHENAVLLTPDGHANKPGCLDNLGNSLSRRFLQFGDIADINKAITAQNDAVLLTPNGHAKKPNYLNNLGGSFGCRFTRSGDIIHIGEAITAHKQAVDLTPDGHADKPDRLRNLGKSFSCRFKASGDVIDESQAISHFRSAAISPAGPPPIRFQAALSWARLCSKANVSSALEGYAVALNLLPRVVWLGQTIKTRHKELISLGGVASEAAAVAISAAQYDTALEWLEQGRSIVWNQLLQLRTPIDALRDKQPALAEDLMRVSKALEHASSRHTDTHDQLFSLEEVAQGHRRLAEEWEKLVQAARGIPGFEDFLQPKKLAYLLRASNDGPVVVINVHKRRCDALVLMSGLYEVMHIPLDRLSYKRARALHQSLNRLLIDSGVRARGTRHLMRLVSTTTGPNFPSILLALWSYVAKPVLDGLAVTASCTEVPPRIWWCATGPLAFLPIHAAGIYDNSTAATNISDYVVSSYTPSVTALINATDNHEGRGKFRGLLAVSQPNTPGQSPLPNTTVELGEIMKRKRNFGVHGLEGPAASVASVLEGMETHSWIHLACHAVQDKSEPTKSAFCLHDNDLDLRMIITKSFSQVDFAFLSACQTATGDEKLSEEALHLAAGLMLAGYCGVIGTMWSIADGDAPVIAGHIYDELFDNTEPDSTKAALALHHAVRCLRQQVGDSAFLSWVPFIHVGI